MVTIYGNHIFPTNLELYVYESFYVWGLFLISPNSSDTVWFIRIKEPWIAETSSEDDCGQAVVAGQSYIIGNFLKISRSNSKGHYFKIDSRTSYFYHESIMYPFCTILRKEKWNFNWKFWIFWNYSILWAYGNGILVFSLILLVLFSVHCFCWYLVLDSYYG